VEVVETSSLDIIDSLLLEYAYWKSLRDFIFGDEEMIELRKKAGLTYRGDERRLQKQISEHPDSYKSLSKKLSDLKGQLHKLGVDV
jgi:hypothetical protein